MTNESDNDFTKLLNQIGELFSKDDLDPLCHELRIDPEELPDHKKSAKIQELLQICANDGREKDLLDLLTRERPNGNWPDSYNFPASLKYRDDIERLRQKTVQSIRLTKKHSCIKVGKEEIPIKRDCVSALNRAAKEGSLVVVGEPGAGKTGALHELVTNLRNEYDVVFITIDSLEANSLGGIRAELGLSYDIVEVMANWEGEKPGFFVIDALDAARSGQKIRAVSQLLSLILDQAERWHVIASIRKFDLRYGLEIKELFAGVPPTYVQDQEFNDVCHINIPLLEDKELQQIEEQSPLLHQLITTAPPEFKDLLRVPFTLNLAGTLLTSGVKPSELISVNTQIELLEKYWQIQVIRSDSQGDARQALLRQVVNLMVSEQALSVSRSRVVGLSAANSVLLTDLLSSQILSEWISPGLRKPESEILTFGHHVLYDYAIARLLLRGSAKDFVRMLSEQKQWSLTIRPSLVLHFQYLWQLDETRHRFWEVALDLIASSEVPAIGKIIASGIAVQFTSQISDLEPLFTVLAGSRVEKRDSARYAFQHMLGILSSETANIQHPLIGEGAGPWSVLAEKLSEEMSLERAYLIQRLLSLLLESPNLLTEKQLYSCGTAARRLLAFAWGQPMRNSWLVLRALEAVCRTFGSDCQASANLLRHALEQDHLEEFGYEEMPKISSEILAIVPFDPEFAIEIYKRTFEYKESSTEETHSGGQILSFITTRKQNYEGALFHLALAFPHFLNISPEYAIQALVVVLETYAYSHPYRIRDKRLARQSFTFQEYQAYFERDYSTTWDSDLDQHDDPIKMLNAFSDYLNVVATHSDNSKLLEQIIGWIGQYNHLAVLWRKLLVCGTSHPQNIGIAIKSLAWASPILLEGGTVNEAARFISAIYPFLSKTERKQVEKAILSIPDFLNEGRAERLRNFHLQSIPPELLASAKAKRVLNEITAIKVDPNTGHQQVDLPDWMSHEERGDLRATASQHEVQIMDQTTLVKEFIQSNIRSKHDTENIHRIMENLVTNLTNADEVNPGIFESATNSIIEACEAITRIEEFSCESETGQFVREILLMVAKYHKPPHHPEGDKSFDDRIFGEIPAPRVRAAHGLILIARRRDCMNEAVHNAILSLSTDPVPAVRFQIAQNCDVLYGSAPQLMWQLIEHFSQQEKSKGVLQGLLKHPLRRLLDTETDRIVEATGIIFNKAQNDDWGNVQERCARLFLRAYLLYGHELGRQRVIEILKNPIEYHNATHRILLNLRNPLSADSSDPNRKHIRSLALQIFASLVRTLHDIVENYDLDNQQPIFTELPSDEQGQIRNLAQLINAIGSEVYFASGAFAEKEINQTGRKLALLEKEHFLREFEPIFSDLAEIAGIRLFGHGFGGTTHKIIETLQSLVPANPSQVFYWLGQFIQASKKTGYQYEPLAAKQVVKIIRLYLAQYRDIIQNEHQETLIEILDVFVEAGWPEAIQLTYRLDEVFR